MRRWGFTIVVLTLAGCNALRDAFSAHPEVAGVAAGQTLTVERLADLAGRAKKIPLRPDALTGLATVYLDYAVYAVELARGRDLHDSALVLVANWPIVSQLKWEHFHDQLLAAHAKLTPAQTDSAYEAGTIRLFQHILIKVPVSAAPPVEQEKKQQVEGLLREATGQHGSSFARLAKRYSDDPGTKSGGGYLAATGRGRFVPAFDTAAWHLAPGAISGVVRSPYGFHIIRRPPLAEVRDSFRAGIENALTLHLDSVYLDSLSNDRELRVESGAPALMRQAIQQLVRAREDRRRLVTYRGGAFQVKDLVRWIFAIDPNDTRGIATASDTQLRQFVKALAERQLLLEQVDSAGIQLTPEDWRQIRIDHDSVLTVLESLLGFSAQTLRDSATEGARVQLAIAHVNSYLDRVADAKAQFFPVPPFVAEALRDGQPRSISASGVARAVERAQMLRAAADSASRNAAPNPAAALRPAPGPAPVDTSRREARQ